MKAPRTPLRNSLWVGILAALAASACCIGPVLAAFAGIGSLAGSLHWLAPARPYLLVFTALALGYAWWLKLRSVPAADNCCDVPTRVPLHQRTGFLVAVTVFAVLTSAFPLYADLFHSASSPKELPAGAATQRIVIAVNGMTCESCEQHVSAALLAVDGVASATASFAHGTATVAYDPTLTNADRLMAAVDSTGYSAVGTRPTSP